MSWTLAEDELMITAVAPRATAPAGDAGDDPGDRRWEALGAAEPPARWQPTVPRASGTHRRGPPAAPPAPAAEVAGSETCAFAVPHDVAVRFRTLCALRGVDQARVLERLVRSWVILGLAEGPGRAARGAA